MPQLPENIRPAIALLVKHHFWLLATLVPLVLLPLLSAARGSLQGQIAAAQGQIQSKLQALQGIRVIEPHPNEGWLEGLDAETGRLRQETLAEWEQFWASQEGLRVWPADLGNDFLQAAKELKPGGVLNRNLLQWYQNKIPSVVRKLPARIGADEAMVEDRDGGQAAAGAGRAADDRRPRPLVDWAAEDQRRLYKSFEWQQLPRSPLAATTQVVLAQEELWVYGLLCDAIARANKDAAGAHSAAIVRVERLAVGYPAAEERPGGTGGSRIVMPKQTTGPGAEAAMPIPDADSPPGTPVPGGALSKPPHPRFGGEPAGPLPGAEAIPGIEGTPAAAPDASLREWIYVDFDGRPLSAADLATSPAARMVHLVPFALEIVIDQRRLDAFLVDLGNAAVPIDVREVRINAGDQGNAGMPPGGSQPGGQSHGRPLDIRVELRGTVGLAAPPNAAGVGIEPQPAPATDAAAIVPPVSDGASIIRSGRRRETVA